MRLRDVTVLTSDGRIAKFDQNYIIKQIKRDAKAANIQISDEEINNLLSKIKTQLRKLDIDQLTGSIIRGVVNDILIKNNYSNIYKSSVKNGIPLSDYIEYMKGNGKDQRENANQMIGPETDHKWIADRTMKEMVMNFLPEHLSKLHIDGTLHCHDMEYFLRRPFCFDSDLRYIFYYGLLSDGSGTHTPYAGPAKHPETAILHACTALGSQQTCFAGGQGYQNFLLFLAPYMAGLSYETIKQHLQMFVFQMGQMIVARGGQVIFSSIQLMPGVPKIWKDKPVVAYGKIWNGKQEKLWTYGELEREVRLMYEAITEVYMEGDYNGKPHSFPKYEMVLRNEFLKDDVYNNYYEDAKSYKELYLKSFMLAAKFGTPYIDNQLPPYRDVENGISCFQCCAYSFGANKDTMKNFDKKLIFEDGEHFSLGSKQVVSINLPQLAYKSGNDYDLLMKNTKKVIDAAVEIFCIKEDLLNRSYLPFSYQTPVDPNDSSKRGPPFVDLDDLPYVIGLVGLNECIEYLYKLPMHETEDGWLFGLQYVTDIKQYILSLDTPFSVSLARTPAESTAQRFAICDCFNINDNIKNAARSVVKGDLNLAINTFGNTSDLPIYYSNGTHVDVAANINIFEKIKYEDPFFVVLDGGNIFHIFLGEYEPDPAGLMDFCLKVAKNTNISYFVINKNFTGCLDCNWFGGGLLEKCPKCGSDNIEGYARITGYFMPISGWNAGKKAELVRRHQYNGDIV